MIIDINMPKLDGKQTLRAIRNMADYEDLPVVLFSTSTMPKDAEYARRYHATFQTKPIHTGQIDPLIEKMLEHCADELKNRLDQNRKRG
ncbi:hypothetical protein GCM10023184_28230 [Flaviaesturariibacter amylovorans]|uniref:Response regulatory domain-containing protein n=1 Tax=Flaviaesturariibacter amylovorans TaxID=1084520 RepID=A0ABP8H584_9BACT